MLLKEFFGNPIDLRPKQEDNNPQLANNLYEYIIDHDKLHKDYFFPLAKKIKESESLEEYHMLMPMVIKGCKEYYVEKKMHGKLGKIFPKELREELCKKLFEYYKEAMRKDKFKIG